MKHDWNDHTVSWDEDHLQMAVAQALKRLEKERDDFTFAADMSGMAAASKGEAGRSKLKGMRRGETDVRIYMAGARLCLVELKLTGKGSVSGEQKDRHAKLRALGFDVAVVWAKTPAEARDKVMGLVMARLNEQETS